jgi:hypothetical protein
MFLWHFPSGRPDRTLSCTLPYEARTFLTACCGAAVRRTPRTQYIMENKTVRRGLARTVRTVVEARRLELLTLTLPA